MDLAGAFEPTTAIVITMLIAAVGALASGKFVVPRFIFDREKEARDKSEAQVSRLTDLLEDYNEQLRSMRRGQKDD